LGLAREFRLLSSESIIPHDPCSFQIPETTPERSSSEANTAIPTNVNLMPHGGITSQYKSRLGAPEARLFAERPARTVVQKAHNSSRN